MAATQRRTLAIAQPLHIKQESLDLRPLSQASSISQPRHPSIFDSNSKNSLQLDGEPSQAATVPQQSNGYHCSADTTEQSVSLLGGKAAKIQHIVEEAASPESRRVVEMIVTQVQQLTTAEKLLLYLKLPGGRNGTAGLGYPDPLRQPMNPLGTRFEIQQTITWIRTHLTEDPDISLPKQEVYDEYLAYCGSNQMKPLSTADFGKVMKQVFPRVRPRRLGTRGNSRYCYAGLCKRMRLIPPLLPDLGVNKEIPQVDDNLEAAASFLIREWAQKLLGQRFNNLRDLAYHLVDKMCVDGRSVAAFALLSSASESDSKHVSPTPVVPSPASQSSSKPRDTQLQRKVHEKESNKEHKRKTQQEQDKFGESNSSRPTSGCKRLKIKNGRNSVESPIRRSEPKKRQSPPETAPLTVAPSTITSANHSPSGSTGKLPIPRLSNTSSSNNNSIVNANSKVSNNLILISPSQPKLAQRKKYKLIQPKPDPPTNGGEEARFFTEPTTVSDSQMSAVSIPGLEKDALDEYLHGGNSQEPEEELMLYFNQTVSSPPTPVPAPQLTVPVIATAPEEKHSQLRLLLERNFTKDSTMTHSNTRRRVSFETSADTVPPSPNTRRRIFSFTPISPDAAPDTTYPPPPSPASGNTLRSSAPSGANASPFVSPRNTPVPRSRHNSGQQFVFPPGPSRTRHCSSGGIAQKSSLSTTHITKPRHFSGTSLSQSTFPVIMSQTYEDTSFVEPTSAPQSPMLAPSSLSELAAHQRQRHVSAGPHFHLQLPQQMSLDPLAQEVSTLLSEPLPSTMVPAFRSQSVPLHQMARQFADPLGSTNNSIAPTPVPSEFADFLENEPFNVLACEQLNHIFMDSDDALLEPTRHFSSRSYPNTPIPDIGGPALGGLNITETSSRSYPSTPVVPDPLIHMTLNAINQESTFGARRNLAQLLEQAPSFPADQTNFSADQVTFSDVGVEHSTFVAVPDQPSFLMDDFDQSDLTQLVQEVEGSTQLSHEGSLE